MDAAFKSHAFPACTLSDLKAIALPTGAHLAEIARRERVAAGDYSVATSGEKLRAVRAGLL